MRINSYAQKKESLLDKIAAWWRMQKVKKYIPQNAFLCDLGCGYRGKFVKKMAQRAKKAIGVDLVVDSNVKEAILIKADLNHHLPLKTNSQNVVTAMAVIEHLSKPDKAITEVYRILQPGGKCILTTPTPKAKKLLEFLAFKLKLISEKEIKEHKKYYNKDEIQRLLKKAGFKRVQYSTFQYGFNSLVIAKK